MYLHELVGNRALRHRDTGPDIEGCHRVNHVEQTDFTSGTRVCLGLLRDM